MSLYASVCNNTVVMWPLFIELIVSFLRKNNTGTIFVTQGKLRENTGNFILARMWPPWVNNMWLSQMRRAHFVRPASIFVWKNGCKIQVAFTMKGFEPFDTSILFSWVWMDLWLVHTEGNETRKRCRTDYKFAFVFVQCERAATFFFQLVSAARANY